MDVYKKLKELGITLPGVTAPGGNYAPAERGDRLIFTAGQTPKVGGSLTCKGKLGSDVSEREGYDAARLCALNCLGNVEYLAGGLDNVERIVKTVCYISSAPDFFDQAKVANGATDLLCEVFGECGKSARSAIGVAVLPGNAAVEVELIVQVKDTARCKTSF